jgi:hypothetical protein
LLVVNVLLVERPADPLGDTTLDLTLNITRMDSPADVLCGGIPKDLYTSGFRIDLDIANVGGKGWPSALGVD